MGYYEKLVDTYGRSDKLRNLARCYDRIGKENKARVCKLMEVEALSTWLHDNRSNSSQNISSSNSI